MPSPGRNQYSNKESVKVDAGLDLGTSDGACNVASWLATNIPAVDIEFSQIVVPVIAPAVSPIVDRLVHHLLQSPPHAFLHSTLSMQWVMGTVGIEHMEFRQSDERFVLARDLALRKKGAELGMPVMYME